MARPIVIRVFAAPLNAAHVIDMLEGCEESGFFRGDDHSTPVRNDCAKRAAPAIAGPFEVFAEGPLKGRTIASASLRMQTLALAPRLVLYEGADEAAYPACEEHDAYALWGTAFVVSNRTSGLLLDAYAKLGIDDEELRSFLWKHLGMTAAIVTE